MNAPRNCIPLSCTGADSSRPESGSGETRPGSRTSSSHAATLPGRALRRSRAFHCAHARGASPHWPSDWGNPTGFVRKVSCLRGCLPCWRLDGTETCSVPRIAPGCPDGGFAARKTPVDPASRRVWAIGSSPRLELRKIRSDARAIAPPSRPVVASLGADATRRSSVTDRAAARPRRAMLLRVGEGRRSTGADGYCASHHTRCDLGGTEPQTGRRELPKERNSRP